MKYSDKRNLIMNDIAKYMPLFNKQAYIKLRKRKQLLNTPSDHLELVSDVVFSVINKLDEYKYIDKFYIMYMDNQLYLYILKGIDRNCTSFTAPFLRKKKRYINMDELSVKNLIVEDSIPMDSDTIHWNNLSKEQQDKVIAVKDLLEPESAIELFGDHWKYFVNLFKEYIDNPKASYRSISEKYGVPISSIYSHINITKNIIKNKLKENESN